MADTIRSCSVLVEQYQPELALKLRRGLHVQSSLHADVRDGGTRVRFSDESGNLAGRRGRRALKRYTSKKTRRLPVAW